MPKSLQDLAEKNPWPAVAAFAIAVSGALVFITTAPDRVWGLVERLPIESWVGIGLMVMGWGGSVAARSLFTRAAKPSEDV